METTDSGGPGTPSRSRQLRSLPAIIRRSTLRMLVSSSVRSWSGCTNSCRHLLQTSGGSSSSHPPETPTLQAVPTWYRSRSTRTQRPPQQPSGQQFLNLTFELLQQSSVGGTSTTIAQSGYAPGSRITRHNRETVS